MLAIALAQCGCIVSLGVFIVYAIIDCVKVSQRELEEVNDNGWCIMAARVGKAKFTWTHWLMRKKEFSNVIMQPLGRYTMGNHIWDDVYVDCSRGKVKIHLNMRQNKIRLTVMKGEVMFHNYLLPADCEKETLLYDGDKVILGDVELRFMRGGVSQC